MWETEPAPLLSLTIRRPRRCPCLHTTTTIIAAALSARRSHTIMNAPHSLYCRSFRVHEVDALLKGLWVGGGSENGGTKGRTGDSDWVRGEDARWRRHSASGMICNCGVSNGGASAHASCAAWGTWIGVLVAFAFWLFLHDTATECPASPASPLWVLTGSVTSPVLASKAVL